MKNLQENNSNFLNTKWRIYNIKHQIKKEIGKPQPNFVNTNLRISNMFWYEMLPKLKNGCQKSEEHKILFKTSRGSSMHVGPKTPLKIWCDSLFKCLI